ncbi:MAG: DUF3788 domain-containing protein [Bacteroidia bacterium]|nr:DUF3788 domain-containing protein [Bacteroidia bacterium]
MPDASAFMAKDSPPSTEALKTVLADTYGLWERLRAEVLTRYPKAVEEWSFPGKTFGWSFRVKDSKRVIVYMLPREGYFKAAFNFGQRAVDEIMGSGVAPSIKEELAAARVYAEGRGIRIDVRKKRDLQDVLTLVEIKLRC